MLIKDRYDVLDKIGSGTFGSVHRALDRVTGEQVAIKFLIKTDTIDHFRKEANFLYQQINNRFVVKLLDHDLDAKEPYIVLEYCHGGSLRSWVGRKNPWQQIANALSCATSGLSEIHKNGGFHRDIKPDNLLMTTDSATGLSVIKLGDLGLARMPSAGSMTYSPAGTKHYMAPEVRKALIDPSEDSYQYTQSADIYSLGITALELSTGEVKLKALERLGEDNFPRSLIDLIRRMCASKPESRPNTEIIAKELCVLLAPPPPPISRREGNIAPLILHPKVVQPQPVERAAPPNQQGDNTGAVIAGIGLGALALLGLAALLTESKEWDPSVERYRDANGRFRRS
mgnify:CR=1 FL=1